MDDMAGVSLQLVLWDTSKYRRLR